MTEQIQGSATEAVGCALFVLFGLVGGCIGGALVIGWAWRAFRFAAGF